MAVRQMQRLVRLPAAAGRRAPAPARAATRARARVRARSDRRGDGACARLEGAGGDVLALLGAADGEAAPGDDEGEGRAAPAAGFTDEELQWGRKEAKARLGAEAFKEWRKAARKAAKS